MPDTKIGVLVRTSLVDYPGKVAAAIFLRGCNLRCPYCHNRELVTGTPPDGDMVSLRQVMEHLDRRKNVLSGLVISGGEPTLSPFTEELIAEARRLGYLIKLDTNGMRPETLERYLSCGGLRPDFVALDIKTSPSRYGIMGARNPGQAERDIIRSAGIVASMPPERREYRTVLVPGLAGHDDIRCIAALLPNDAAWNLARFRPGECLDADYNRIQPYTEAQYEELAATARAAVPGAKIR